MTVAQIDQMPPSLTELCGRPITDIELAQLPVVIPSGWVVCVRYYTDAAVVRIISVSNEKKEVLGVYDDDGAGWQLVTPGF